MSQWPVEALWLMRSVFVRRYQHRRSGAVVMHPNAIEHTAEKAKNLRLHLLKEGCDVPEQAVISRVVYGREQKKNPHLSGPIPHPAALPTHRARAHIPARSEWDELLAVNASRPELD